MAQPRRRGDPPGGGRGSGRLRGLRRADGDRRDPARAGPPARHQGAGRHPPQARPLPALRVGARAGPARPAGHAARPHRDDRALAVLPGRDRRHRGPVRGRHLRCGRGTEPWIRREQAGICRTGRPWRLPRGAGPHQPASSRAVLRRLPGRSRRPRGQPAVRDRAHRRDARADQAPGRPVRPAPGRDRGGQRRRAYRQHRLPVPGPAGRGLPGQADPGLVA